MGEPTIYKLPRKSITPRNPSDRVKAKWKKHREAIGKSPELPKLKK